MISFKKFTSIENSFNEEFMNKVRAEIPKDIIYVVQEKVHGANVSFICNGEDIQFAKRTAILEPDEAFFQYQAIVDKYRNNVFSLFNFLKIKYPLLQCISIFGELFGGSYPLADVKKQNKLDRIQKGIYYTPEHEFYGFDIFLNFGGGGSDYMSVEDTNNLFDQFGFFYAKTLFSGTLDECLQYPNKFESTIAKDLGLPILERNFCEGVVIRPATPLYLRNGSRVLIKNKNPKFAECIKGRSRQFRKSQIGLPKALEDALSLALCYITENRLNNVISHIGQVDLSKDFGKVLGMYCKDVITDFSKENGEIYQKLSKEERKLLNKEIQKVATKEVNKAKMNK